MAESSIYIEYYVDERPFAGRNDRYFVPRVGDNVFLSANRKYWVVAVEWIDIHSVDQRVNIFLVECEGKLS
jgi:hypothetical protein